MKVPVFIIGTQRSGTTLLCRILSVHPEIFIRNELPSPGVVRIFTPGRSRETILRDINRAMEESQGADLITFLRQNQKTRWGLKDPELTHCLKPLHDAFPDGKYIIIVRDGRAVANSYIKNKWGLGVNTYYGAKRWQREVTIQMSFYRTFADQCHVVRFEDLIADHVKELKKICSFLDEPFAEELREYYKYNTVITNRQQSKNAFKKPDIRLAKKWQQDLSPFQISVFENVAGDTLMEHEYKLTGTKIHISAPLKIWFFLHQRIKGEFQIQYQWRFKPMYKRYRSMLITKLRGMKNTNK